MKRNDLGVIVVILAIAAVVGLAVVGFLHLSGSSSGRGGTSNADSISLGSNLNIGGLFVLGTNGGSQGDTNWNGGFGKTEQVSVQFCGGSGKDGTGTATYQGYPTTYVGSTTQFAVNPYFGIATSTVTITSATVSGEATSSMFAIGTTTQLVGVALSTLTTVGASTTVATSSTGMYLTPGVSGFTNAGGGNSRTFLVGPTQYVAAIATSSGSYQSISYTQGVGCTVKLTFTI